MKKTKILVISQYFWPENFRINDLALGLKERGADVTVLTGIPNYPGGKFFPGYNLFRKKDDYNGIIIKRVPVFPRGKAGKFRLVLNYLSFVLSAGFFLFLRCRAKYDAVFVFATSPITSVLPAVLYKAIRKTPLVLWVLDLWPESLLATNAVRSPLILKLVDKLVRFIYGSCDSILVSSEGFIKSVSSRGVLPEKIVFFPNWAEQIYRPVAFCKERLPIKESDIPAGFKLMFAGNIGVAQDFGTVLGAFEKLKDHPDIHLLVVGTGRKHAWVEQQVRERGLGGQIHLLGAYPLEAMPDFFSIADAMLVSLKEDPLFSITIPGKIQSYMACGKPIIGALEGEGARLINVSYSGFSCSPGKPEELCAAIIKMYNSSISERRRMSANASRYNRENFNRDRLVEDLFVLIGGLSSKKNTGKGHRNG